MNKKAALKRFIVHFRAIGDAGVEVTAASIDVAFDECKRILVSPASMNHLKIDPNTLELYLKHIEPVGEPLN